MSKVNSFNWGPEKCCFSSPHPKLSIFLLNISDSNISPPPFFFQRGGQRGLGGRSFEVCTESTDRPAVGQ